MLDEAIIKWGAAVFISYYVIKELMGIVNKFILKNGLDSSSLSSKVDKIDCVDFRTRIGKESDDHRKDIVGIKHDITEIKEGVAFLKGRSQ